MIVKISLLASVLWLASSAVSGKPTEIVTADVANILSPRELNPIENANDKATNVDITRQQRSPQFGLLNDYDYSDEDEDYEVPRTVKLAHKRKPHKLHHKPLNLHGGYGEGYHNGCRGYDCGESWHSENGHSIGNHEGQHGGSFATASAGSIGGGGSPYGGGHSEASSQSASFNFGPYSATFSVAQAASGRERF